MKASFLIPTIRPYARYAKVVVESIIAQCKDVEYEILVSSPSPSQDSRINWYKENSLIGPIKATNLLASEAKGEYLIQLVDDHILLNSIAPTINVLDELKSSDRRFRIASLNPGNSCFNPVRNQVLGDKIIDFDVKKFPLCRFPVMPKSSLSLLGGVFWNESHYYHSADIWLGYWLGLNNEPSFESPTNIAPHLATKNSEFEVRDCNITRKLIYYSTINSSIKYNTII